MAVASEANHVAASSTSSVISYTRRKAVDFRMGGVLAAGGAVGVELGQALQRLGSAVTLIEAGPRLLSREDPEAVALVTGRLEAEGVRILTETRALSEPLAATSAKASTQAGPYCLARSMIASGVTGRERGTTRSFFLRLGREFGCFAFVVIC